MDLSAPLRTLIPSLDSAVLEVLAGTESSLGLAQIARLAGRGSRQGHALVLDRLVEHGLVIEEPANRGSLYRLNRDHLLAEPIMAARKARSTLLLRLRAGVEVLRPEPIHASLFGSFARKHAGPASDIDLLIVRATDEPPADEWSIQIRDLGDRVLGWTGNRLEIVVISAARLREAVERGEPVVESWLDEAVLLHGIPLQDAIGRPDCGSPQVA